MRQFRNALAGLALALFLAGCGAGHFDNFGVLSHQLTHTPPVDDGVPVDHWINERIDQTPAMAGHAAEAQARAQTPTDETRIYKRGYAAALESVAFRLRARGEGCRAVFESMVVATSYGSFVGQGGAALGCVDRETGLVTHLVRGHVFDPQTFYYNEGFVAFDETGWEYNRELVYTIDGTFEYRNVQRDHADYLRLLAYDKREAPKSPIVCSGAALQRTATIAGTVTSKHPFGTLGKICVWPSRYR